MIEELSLLVNDGLGDAQDGVEALLDVADQPARFLQLAAEPARLSAVLLQQAGVQAVDAQARHGVLVQAHRPAAAQLAHDHVGQHVARLAGRVA